jgi:Phytanoyl-CoA dioxygenase (PhyH)
MASPHQMAAAVQALMKKAELSSEEVTRRLALLRDRDYWRQLVPFATIEARTNSDTPHETMRIAAGAAARETGRIAGEGYFRLEEVVEAERIGRMRRTVEAVRAARWPPVFAFLFDDFWSIAQSQALLGFVEASLGPRCLQNTVIWAHWVAGEAGHEGWSPHVDAAREGNRFLSVWIALSDATVNNGCMSLVRPRAIAPEIAHAIEAHADLDRAAYRGLLQNVVALPVKAGSIIGWRGDVLHWGGVNTGDASPRVSLALEFRSRDSTATKFEAPLIDPRDGPPPFALRLFAISKALREYPKFEPMMERFRGLAERLWEETKPV